MPTAQPSRPSHSGARAGGSRTAAEIATQPDLWRRAAGVAQAAALLGGARPEDGTRTAVTGCGTSWYVAQCYAALREEAGRGETDAFAASEFPIGRDYGFVLAITRSGTTTEVLDLLRRLAGRTRTAVLTADPTAVVRRVADRSAVLDWADEQSVVQTRFATSTLALLRASLGEPAERAAADAERALAEALPAAAPAGDQFTFLGSGWTCGLAREAALKLREAAGAWTEAYPAMEYRHGPISVTGPGRVTWVFGDVPAGLDEEVARTGGTLIADSRTDGGSRSLDPLADLVRVQRLAVALAEARGMDPDRPRHLARSVVLP